MDDDEPTRTMLARFLATEGYDVDDAADGPSALAKAGTRAPDLVLLDVMMPGQDGLDVLKRLRDTSDVGVILLTARAQDADRVIGFRYGADDYIVKPFSVAELAARVEAVLRRTAPSGDPAQLSFNGLAIDLGKREVTVRGRPVDLRPREFELLAFLASSPQKAFSREELLDRVWPGAGERNESTVTEHVGRLRRRIEDDPDRPRWIRTVRGVGYRFQP